MLCLRFTDGLWMETRGIYCAHTDNLSSVQTKGSRLLEVLGIPCVLQLKQAYAGNVPEIFTLSEQTEPLKSQREITNFLISNSLVEECACPQCTIATLTPIEDNWVCSHTYPKVSILCLNGHKALTISPLIMFCRQTFPQRCCKEHTRDK